jgi:hypothetical protein
MAMLLLAGCGDSPMEFDEWWMDSLSVFDPSLHDPNYRLSTRPGMTRADRSRPVVVAVHGFTASTFEWQEFRAYAEGNSPVLVSLVRPVSTAALWTIPGAAPGGTGDDRSWTSTRRWSSKAAPTSASLAPRRAAR